MSKHKFKNQPFDRLKIAYKNLYFRRASKIVNNERVFKVLYCDKNFVPCVLISDYLGKVKTYMMLRSLRLLIGVDVVFSVELLVPE